MVFYFLPVLRRGATVCLVIRPLRRKGTIFFEEMQENGDFFAIFSLENAWRRYSLEAKILGGGTLRTRLMFFGAILTNSTFCWRGVVPLFARSSPALLSAEEGKV